MSMKEKLDLLWKYLLLAVLVYGFYQIGHPQPQIPGHAKLMKKHHDKMLWFDSAMDEEMDIDVKVEKISDSDSSVVVTINGETIDLDGIDLEDFDTREAQIFVKKLKGKGQEKCKREMEHPMGKPVVPDP